MWLMFVNSSRKLILSKCYLQIVLNLCYHFRWKLCVEPPSLLLQRLLVMTSSVQEQVNIQIESKHLVLPPHYRHVVPGGHLLHPHLRLLPLHGGHRHRDLQQHQQVGHVILQGLCYSSSAFQCHLWLRPRGVRHHIRECTGFHLAAAAPVAA